MQARLYTVALPADQIAQGPFRVLDVQGTWTPAGHIASIGRQLHLETEDLHEALGAREAANSLAKFVNNRAFRHFEVVDATGHAVFLSDFARILLGEERFQAELDSVVIPF